MRVHGYLGKYEIHILIDSGSTHHFIDYNTAKKLGCQMMKTYPLQVTVTNGNDMTSNSMCSVKWRLQSEEFCADMMVLPLGGCEMVLGIQWFSTLGNITCNFKDLKMGFMYYGKWINLRGTQKSALQWLHGKQLGKSMGHQAQLSSMVLCVYPESILNMVSVLTTCIDSAPTVMKTLLDEYAVMFSVPKESPPFRSHDHRIPLKERTQPINIRPYRHPPIQKDAIENMVQEL